MEQECPTWWRLYIYVADEDRAQTLNERRTKHELELGKGGEGYIAEDEWCYNCGEVGHWGDVCFESPLHCYFLPPSHPTIVRIVKRFTGGINLQNLPLLASITSLQVLSTILQNLGNDQKGGQEIGNVTTTHGITMLLMELVDRVRGR